MAKKSKKDTNSPEDSIEKDTPEMENTESIQEDEDDSVPVYEDRKKQWMRDEGVIKELCDIHSTIMCGFDDKAEQTRVIERAYDAYNCMMNENQMYDGDSKIYLPIVHDAIEARVTRFCNSIFPQTGRYAEVMSNDGKVPYETMAMLDYYVEQCSLRESVVPSLMRSGDITGQYSLFLSWNKKERHTVKKVKKAKLGTPEGEVFHAGTLDDIEYETVEDSRPDVSVLDPRDLLILPASVDNIDDADVVAVALRLSKGRIQELIDSGEFDEEAGEELMENMTNAKEQQPNPDKKNLNAAGIKTDSKGGKTALVYMVWTKLKIGGKRRRCLAYMSGPENLLSCKRNPYWSDRIPVITQPALKVSGSIWGKSRVEPVEKMQYAANDAFNMGQDSIKYSLCPITIVDPEKFQRVSSVVLTMGAIWSGDPNALRVEQFPSQWAQAERVVDICTSKIMQALGTNPAMMVMGGGGSRPTQAQIAQEQQVALESTSDVVTILENSILNDLLRWFYEMDYQFRDKAIHVRRFGPVGLQAEMQEIPPMGVDSHYTFKWYGTEGTKSAQQIQQMISMLNVMQQMPPAMLNGRKIDAGPIIEQAANVTFGPKVAPKVLIDQSHMLSIAPAEEDLMMSQGFQVMVSPEDDDRLHIQAHTRAGMETGDPAGLYHTHIQEHIKAMQMKQQQQIAGAMQGQQPGGTGGPRPGAQVQMPTGPQQPPGAVRPDDMDATMPRERAPIQ